MVFDNYSILFITLLYIADSRYLMLFLFCKNKQMEHLYENTLIIYRTLKFSNLIYLVYSL